jgi:hypothetical protein
MIPYKKPHNSSKRILAFKMAHPTYTTSRIAKVLNLRYRLVYNTLYTYRALGGPDTLSHINDLIEDYQPNSKLAFDLQKKEESSEPTRGQEILREVIADGLNNAENIELRHKVEVLEHLVESMKTQMVGLGNVITYLESRLGITSKG